MNINKFVEVTINTETCLGSAGCDACIKVCPVSIFEATENLPDIKQSVLDECTLCDLCLQQCQPGSITITKLYE